MGLKDLFKNSESLLAVDVGSSSLKLLELDLSEAKPRLVNVASAPLSGDIFSNNMVSKPEKVAEQLTSLIESSGISDRRIVTAVPGPSVFTKRIKMPRMSLPELSDNINFEAGNFIPHNVDAVKLDFHVIGSSQKNQLDVLVVAVKNEIIDSFLTCFNVAGLETAVVDVDYFALQNTFEISYPELIQKTVALINIGARYSSINICRAGESLFTGDIATGGKVITEAMLNGLNISFDEAEKVKRECDPNSSDGYIAVGILEKQVESMAAEFNRQLSFFWNASGAEEGIDTLVLSGGGALANGLPEKLAEKTGIECVVMDPLRELACGPELNTKMLEQVRPLMAVAVGMAIRQPGDKIVPDLD